MESKQDNPESEGLGDDIAKITHALGLDIIAERVAHAMGKEDCGCDKRRELLNEMFPKRKNKVDKDI